MPSNEYCLHTVSVSYNYITFSGEGHGTYYGPKCLNPLRTISTYASGKTFCTDIEIAIGFEKIREECENDGLEFLDWQQVVANITHDDIARMKVVEFDEIPGGTNTTEPVRLSESFFGRVGNTLMTWEYEMNWHHQSSFALYGFWGIVLGVSTIKDGATITMCLLLLLSASWLRIKFYEIFLFLHIVLSVVTLVGCFLHTSIFDARYDAYLWPIVIVWLLDRALRLFRLIACNVHVRLSKQIIHHTHSIASYSKESDVIRLDIRTNSFLTQPAPGQFYYLYQPSNWQGYENHPFTLGAWSSQSLASEDADTYLLQDDNLPNEFDQFDPGPRYQSGVRTLTFWIRPYDGWTRRLRDECLQAPTRIIEPTVLLEGPYGHHCPISSFESVLLIAGGTGIASAVPYILEHMALSKAGKSDTTHMHLLWTARQVSFLGEVFAQELRIAAQRDDFSADLFFTRQGEGPRHGEEQLRSEENAYLRSRLQYGRPDIAAAITKAAIRAEMTGTKVAVLVCGPPAMADEARLAVHRSLKQGYHSLQYLEESFGW
ncbi:putative plasma membrane ferric-chelate reductase, partial [Aureobasidium melanogenum]